jgi:AhpD family alkylhydroperoxidase
MTMDYRATQQSVVDGAAVLREAIPDVIKGFGALGAGTYRPGALEPKIKELIALALAIGAHCDGCIAYHAKAARIAAPVAQRSPRRSGWRSTWARRWSRAPRPCAPTMRSPARDPRIARS